MVEYEYGENDKEPWAYHSTSLSLLASIRRRGLVPRRQPVEHEDEERATREEVTFFSAKPEWASMWGDVLLRFPWPDEESTEQDPYGDSVLLPDGTITYTNWFTHDYVPPESIEVFDGRSWVPLSGFRASKLTIRDRQKMRDMVRVRRAGRRPVRVRPYRRRR